MECQSSFYFKTKSKVTQLIFKNYFLYENLPIGQIKIMANVYNLFYIL